MYHSDRERAQAMNICVYCIHRDTQTFYWLRSASVYHVPPVEIGTSPNIQTLRVCLYILYAGRFCFLHDCTAQKMILALKDLLITFDYYISENIFDNDTCDNAYLLPPPPTHTHITYDCYMDLVTFLPQVSCNHWNQYTRELISAEDT